MRNVALLIALLLAVAVIGALDVTTGPAYGFSLFYLIPIALGAWLGGARVGVPLAAAAAASWLGADLADRTPDSLRASAWNGFTRLVTFTSLALLLAILRARERQALAVEGFRAQVVELIDRQLPPRLDRVRRAARAPGAPSDLGPLVDDLVLLTDSVVALSLVASGVSRATADAAAVLEESARAAAERERVVVGTRAPSPVRIEPRVLRLALSVLVIAALRATTGPVRAAISRPAPARTHVTLELEAASGSAGRDPGARDLADLVLAVTTARAALAPYGGAVTLDARADGICVRIELPTAADRA